MRMGTKRCVLCPYRVAFWGVTLPFACVLGSLALPFSLSAAETGMFEGRVPTYSS